MRLMQKRTNKKCALLLSSAIVSGVAFVGVSYAQEVSGDEVSATDDIISVTGSRIKRSEFDLSVPAQTLNRAELNIAGANELSEALIELPAVSPAITAETSQSSTQSSGQSTVSLRNLGSTRTLTLIDGRRTVGNTSTGSTVDYSTIPDGFVERVEVITGGASALYGSDAVTGVINIITRTDFEGLEVQSRIGTSEEGGNNEYGLDITAGSNIADGRGNVMFAFGYDKETPIREYQRDKAIVALELDENTNGQPDELVPNLSTNIPGGLFAGNGGTALDPESDTSYWYYAGGGTGALQPDFSTDDNGFNALGTETISIPSERFILAGKLDFDLTENAQFFLDAQYSHTATKSERTADTANSSRLGADYPIYLSDGVTPNPLVPQEIFDDAVELGSDSVFFRRSWQEFGNRYREGDNDTLRLWTGVRGDFGETWSYEANFGYGEWRRAQSRVGDLVIPNYLQAIDIEYAVPGDPTSALQCANSFAREAGCEPLNPFGLGSVTEGQTDWLILRDQLRARNRTTTASAWMTGDLVELWAGPVEVAFGYDYRKEESQTRWDPISTSGGGTVTQQVNQDGEQDVHEVFGEVIVPLLVDQPFAHSLSVEGAIRFSDYSTVGTVQSFKFGGNWAPVPDIRFRGIYAQANRAPNNIELFNRGIGSQGGLADPCDGVTSSSTGVFDDACRQDPVVSSIISADGVFQDEHLQVQTPSFGNDELSEETANTLTLGVVYTPSYVSGLRVSLDYYDIEIEDAIGDISAEDIVRLCYGSGDFTGTPSCDIPVRDSVTGQLAEVTETALNLNELKTSGLDITAAYAFAPSDMGIPIPGDVRLSGTMTRVFEFEEKAPTPGTDEVFVSDTLGLLGNPETSARVSAQWMNGPLTVSWRTLMIGEMLNDDVDRTRKTACDQYDNCGDKIALFLDREFTHNLRVAYEFDEGPLFGADTEAFAGVNNLTNNQGPTLYAYNEGVNSGDVGENHNSIYDINGRYYYVGFSVKF